MAAVVEKKLEGRHVLYMLLSFFGVMVAVNMVLVYFAVTSFSGLTEKDPYKKGINYNQVIEAREAQKNRNWSVDLAVEGPVSKTVVTLKITAPDGKVIAAEKVTAVFRHPAKTGLDVEISLSPLADGYTGDVALASAGQWDLYLTVAGGGYDTPYHVEKRIWVK